MSSALAIQASVFLAASLITAAASADDGLVLKSRSDPARERSWILTRSGVVVVDQAKRKAPVHVALPEWVWADESFACPPDLALGPNGEAVVSSNAVPILWRIDPATLAVTRHKVVLDADNDKDVGFSGVVYARELGAYFAVSENGALWRIDSRLTRGQNVRVSTPMPRACAISSLPRAAEGKVSRFSALCVRGTRESWRVNLAPDRRSGYVSPANCN